MSKRFGRNQKRAMRNQFNEQITKQRDQYNELKANTACKNKTIERLTHTVNLTADILGEHFASLPAGTQEVKELRDYYEYAILRPVGYVDQGQVGSFVDTALSRIDVFHAELKADELRGMMQMSYSSRCGAVGYGLSEHAWRNLSEKQLIELVKDQIAPKMATLLVRDMKKAVKRWPCAK